MERLTINHQVFEGKEKIIQFCNKKLTSQKTPPWEKDIYLFLTEFLDQKDFVVVQTSGSTGKPKSITLKKKWMKYSAVQTCNFFNIDSNSQALLCLPAGFIAGKMMIVRALVSGCNLIITQPRANPIENITDQIDFTALTPFQLHYSLAFLKEKKHIKTIIVGGGEISSILEKSVQSLQTQIFATYGMTETSTHIALRRVNGSNPSGDFKLLENTHISIDSRNCLVLENPELFQHKLVTNDIVEIKDENTFRWLGRWDNIINSGGIKLVVEELEQKISFLLNQPFHLVGIPDEKLGMACVMVIQTSSLSTSKKMKLLHEISQVVEKYAVPKEVYTLPEFPLTKSGKVDRLALQKIITMDK